MSLVNIWHLRRVAEVSAKPCDICYKPTSAVLITPDNQDHFYICQTHVKDRGFCSPIVDEAEVAAKKKKEDMDLEIQKIQKEYEEKLKKKKSKNKDNIETEKEEPKEKENEKGKEKGNEDGKKTDDDENKVEREKNEKIRTIIGKGPELNTEEIPRIYALKKVFYQKRLDRKRNAEIAKRDRERFNALKNPSLFPSVPKNNLG